MINMKNAMFMDRLEHGDRHMTRILISTVFNNNETKGGKDLSFMSKRSTFVYSVAP